MLRIPGICKGRISISIMNIRIGNRSIGIPYDLLVAAVGAFAGYRGFQGIEFGLMDFGLIFGPTICAIVLIVLLLLIARVVGRYGLERAQGRSIYSDELNSAKQQLEECLSSKNIIKAILVTGVRTAIVTAISYGIGFLAGYLIA